MFSFQSRVCLFLRKSRQNEGVRGMATLKSISMRLKSVKNIKKITQSMKMVSAAKLSRAERELKQAKPLGEGIKLFYKSIEPEGTPEDLSKKKVLYLAVTSDRGLCGAVHTSVAKIIRNELQDPGENIKIVCIGDKARALLQRSYADNFLFVCQEVGRVPPTFKDASRIVSEIFLSGFDFQIGKVVYNRFRSIVSYSTENINFYDFGTIEGAPSMQTYTEVDGLEDDTLTSFIEFSMVALIFYAMKEGACSEQSSRMTAMDNSSKNAGDMIGKLTLSFNRTRQAVITRELIEIISGASALSS